MVRNYSQGKIYKIVGNDQVYYESTCEPTVARRMATHRGVYRQYQKGNHNFVTSFACLEDDDCYISLIELYPCNSKDELHARERYFIENNDCVNKNLPGRTLKEWKIDNKDKIREYKKEYRTVNKEKIKEQKKEYRTVNKDKIKQKHDCECGGKFTHKNKAIHIKTKKHQQYLRA